MDSHTLGRDSGVKIIASKKATQQITLTGLPQDRAAQAAKLFELFGGKMESGYWFPTGSEYDGMAIVQLPDNVTEEAISLR